MISGIYKIIHNDTGRAYLGSSFNIKHRWNKHKWYLRGNHHPNNHLQNAWNKYGENTFEFIIIEECDQDQLLKKEQVYLDNAKIKPNDYYNTSYIAGRIEITDEVKEKIRRKRIGKKFSEEWRKKMSDARKGKSPSNKGIWGGSNSKDWIFLSPKNEVIHIHSLNHFCNENGLRRDRMGDVFKGRRKQHKGWKKNNVTLL